MNRWLTKMFVICSASVMLAGCTQESGTGSPQTRSDVDRDVGVDADGSPGDAADSSNPEVGMEDNDGDGYDVTVDCDDDNFEVNPGANESCNGRDDDCDGEIDNDAQDAASWYADADKDGFGDPGSRLAACSAPDGYVDNDADCNDADSGINPDAAETCSGVDDNCNGDVDEDGAIGSITAYADDDGDDYGNDQVTRQVCSLPLGYVDTGGDCDDTTETTYPGATELCNQVDDNCNDQVDEASSMGTEIFYVDADMDGSGDPNVSREACAPPVGYVANGDDCNDQNPTVHPGAEDRPDPFDNDLNCDDIDGNLAGAVFVSTSTGNDSNDGRGGAAADGSLDIRPVATLSKAMDIAGACDPDCPVYVVEGTYNQSQTLELKSGVSIYGGFNTNWVHDRPNSAVEITADQSPTVHADGITADMVVADLTIVAPTLSSPSGAESVGLLVTNTGTADRLTLERAQINGGQAAPGSSGADGSYTGAANSGGSGGGTSDCGSENGDNGQGPILGFGGIAGNNNCPNACPLTGSDGISNGTTGLPGGDGAHGSNGGAAPSNVAASFSGTNWVPVNSSGGDDGASGTGGGGGGGGGTKRIRSCFGCGTLLGGEGGDGGKSGRGGGGGGGGGQGGAALTIVLVDSTVTFDQSGVKAGQGGDGGNGGDGSDGEHGYGGQPGRGRSHSKCGLINYYSGNGGSGGTGGEGGGGAGGAGGNGGPSIGVALVGTSSLQSSPAYTPGGGGQPGAGGSGGAYDSDASSKAPDGADGNAGLSEHSHNY